MPIKIPDALPATAILESENIFVMTEYRALHQDIRPLKVLILNLMPTKIVTETQILRKLSNTPVQIQVELLRTASYQSQHTDEDHLASFYTTFDQVRDRNFDGMIITGAPVENLEFNQVDYWPELCEIMAWSRTHVHSTLHICWGAQAGLYDVFCAPHSRYTEVWEKDIRAAPGLELLATSSEAGVYAVKTEDSSQFFIMGHPEYDPDTLAREYRRDIDKGLDIAVPAHYFPEDDPARVPVVRWRSAGQLLYTNWLNYYLYQTTPYDLSKVR